MANSTRILTHKSQRKLTNEQVVSLLTEYAGTRTTYKAMSAKHGISQRAISSIVRGFSYRELPAIANLRKEAQEKAASLCGKYSNAEAAQVHDPTRTVVEVDANSVASVDAAILRLQAMRLLIAPAVEVAF
jgi:hypothetical protein